MWDWQRAARWLVVPGRETPPFLCLTPDFLLAPSSLPLWEGARLLPSWVHVLWIEVTVQWMVTAALT